MIEEWKEKALQRTSSQHRYSSQAKCTDKFDPVRDGLTKQDWTAG